MTNDQLRQLLNKQAVERKLSETCSRWHWRGCTVKYYQESDDYWVLLPGFDDWLKIKTSEGEGEFDLGILPD